MGNEDESIPLRKVSVVFRDPFSLFHSYHHLVVILGRHCLPKRERLGQFITHALYWRMRSIARVTRTPNSSTGL